MPITREFLDVTRPALPEAAEYLRERFATARTFDLSRVIVVVPGGRAGRRLLEILVDLAEANGLMLSPPEIVTIGGLPERLYEPKLPFATTLTQRLAWAKTLRETSPDSLRQLMPRSPESPDDPAWLAWGDSLRKEHAELAADALDFSHVAELITGRVGELEVARWRTLRDIQERYLRLLDELQLWDLQTARLTAVIKGEYHTDQPVILIGVVDLNQTQRDMLDQIAHHVTVLTPAAPEWIPWFDEHGCLNAEAWNDPEKLPVQLDDDQWEQVEGPVEQAEAVVRQIAAYEGKFRADEITVGLADESLVPQVERQMRQCGLVARWGPGKPLAETRPYRLLDVIARWLRRDGYAQWAELLRHPDVGDWLARSGVRADWLARLDEFYNEHLPASLHEELFAEELDSEDLDSEDAAAEASLSGGEESQDVESSGAIDYRAEYHAETRRTLLQVVQAVRHWLRELSGETTNDQAVKSGGAARSLEAWSGPIQRAIQTIYSEPLDLGKEQEAEVWQACQRIGRTLEDFEKVPDRLRPRLKVDEAIRLVIEQSAMATVAARTDPAAIELVGWLELPLDDAPAMIVTSLNDGHVPQSVNADPFLPNTIRSALRLDDNARRFARDAYALGVIRASRLDLHVIVARRDANHDPAAPSRLLFATNLETVARRALRLFDPPHAESTPASLPGAFRPTRAKSSFSAPTPAELLERFGEKALAEPLRLTVSDFKSYLSCPYRFLLSKVARCEAVTDEARELDGGAFGSLAHDVLGAFGASDLKHSADATKISEFLWATLTARVFAQFGARPRPAVQVQVEQLRLRLAAFAEIQARRGDEGWRIAYVEEMTTRQQVRIPVDGVEFLLVGRMDRVDLNGTTGRYGVFDYKTSDHGDGPLKTHRLRDGSWVDLQLPLYRHLAKALEIPGTVELGYVLLPKDVTKVGFVMADWSDEDLAGADAVAWEVVRRIRRREFDPSPDFTTSRYDDYARICLANVLK